MYKEARTITEENFPVFKKLVDEVIVKATGKPSVNNPAIRETKSKTADKLFFQIAEARANEIANEIYISTGGNIGARRLQSLINAALNDDFTINTRNYTLNSLAKFVLKHENTIEIYEDKIGELLYWKSYLEKYKHLLQSDCNNIADWQLGQSDTETDIIPEATVAEITPVDFMPKNEMGAAFLNENSFDNFSKNKTSEKLEKVIDAKKFIRAGFRGGICAGFFTAIIIAVMRYASGTNETPLATGYEKISFGKFMREIFPLLLLFQIFSGALIGWLCCFVAIAKNKFSSGIILFMISFIIIILLRQAMTRDALYLSGTYAFNDRFGNVRMGGGPLGEPDFETIATGIMGAIGFLILAKVFQKTNLKVPTLKEAFGIILKTIIWGISAWCLVYVIYLLLISTILHRGNYFISTSIFVFDFPHPERLIFAALLCMVYTYCIIASIQYQAYKKEVSDN